MLLFCFCTPFHTDRAVQVIVFSQTFFDVVVQLFKQVLVNVPRFYARKIRSSRSLKLPNALYAARAYGFPPYIKLNGFTHDEVLREAKTHDESPAEGWAVDIFAESKTGKGGNPTVETKFRIR